MIRIFTLLFLFLAPLVVSANQASFSWLEVILFALKFLFLALTIYFLLLLVIEVLFTFNKLNLRASLLLLILCYVLIALWISGPRVFTTGRYLETFLSAALLGIVMLIPTILIYAIYLSVSKRWKPEKARKFFAIGSIASLLIVVAYSKTLTWEQDYRDKKCVSACLQRDAGTKWGNWYSMHNSEDKAGERRFCRQVCGIDPISDTDVNVRNFRLQFE